MKTRLVLWGTDGEKKKVLLAIALRAAENKVDIWAFPEEASTESFYKHMIDEWRLGRDMPFPDTFTQYEVPFSSSGELLPEGIQADRSDLLQQAQTEWQFVILSAKLYESHKEEVEFFQNKIERLEHFDQKVWEELKGYWEKVQSQIHERMLFRDHAHRLREKTNALFDQMKTMRRTMDAEFKSVSKEASDKFMEILTDIETRIAEDRGLHPIFEELKKLQRQYHETRLTRDDRNKVWKRLDAAFKAVKEKRFGGAAPKTSSASGRLERRFQGLQAAIGKMEKSIAHDQRDISFEQERIDETHGQLEAQIRQAKLAMIHERIQSKQDKLADMQKTLGDLERRIAQEKKREEARKEQELREQKIGEVKESMKEKIAEDIKHAAEVRSEDAQRLEKAAGEIVEGKRKPRAPRKTSGKKIKGSLAAVSDLIASQVIDALGTGEEE